MCIYMHMYTYVYEHKGASGHCLCINTYVYTIDSYIVISLCPKRNIFQFKALHSTLPFSFFS